MLRHTPGQTAVYLTPPTGSVTVSAQSKNFKRPYLIGPCLHTISTEDLTVPFEGFEDGLTGRSFLMQEAVSVGGGLFFHRLSGQGVRGMGWPTQPVRKSYGGVKRPQLVI